MQILKILTKSRATGDVGEKAAEKYLKKHGYKTIEKNYVAHNNEIDLIVKDKEYLVFVEVKARTETSVGKIEMRPASSVNPDKQRRIIKAARYYLACNPEHGKVRFDVVEVYLSKDEKISKINHIISAFNFNSAYRT